MKENISIYVPKGKKMVETSDENGINIKFVDIVDKTAIKSRSWDEFCRNHPNIMNEFYISSCANVVEYNMWSSERSDDCKNNLSNREDAEGILALIQLVRFHDEWVGDWKYDPNSNEHYHAIVHDIRRHDFYIIKLSAANRLLSFPDQDMAKEFLECFSDLIKKAQRFI